MHATLPPLEPKAANEVASLQGTDWLADERLQRLMLAIAGSDEEIRVVGGAIRNSLMGRPVADIDLATTASPKTVMARTRQSDMRPIPTGLAHGTITVLVAGKPFEVTTLREDVATDGRHAIVQFGRDWATDARRRDFTVNALYATGSGEIFDYVGGVADCRVGKIRFIGDPAARIREDYLRILRLFRFHASFSQGPIDAEALAAAIDLRDGLLTLSSERIGQEILKLCMAKHAPEVLRVMYDAGILQLALSSDTIDLDRFARLHAGLASLKLTSPEVLPPSPEILGLASLADGAAGCDRLARRLRLSNAIRDRIEATWAWSAAIGPAMSDREARALIYRARPDAFRDAVAFSMSNAAGIAAIAEVRHLLDVGKRFSPPKLPLTGRDLIAAGILPGPDLGSALDRLEAAWIASDFKLTRAELIAGLPR